MMFRRFVWFPLILSLLLVPSQRAAAASRSTEPASASTCPNPDPYRNPLTGPALSWSICPAVNSVWGPRSRFTGGSIQLSYGRVVAGSKWFFAIHVVNYTRYRLTLRSQITGIGSVFFSVRGPLSCRANSCYYDVYFDPLVPTRVNPRATLVLRNSGPTSGQSSPITLTGSAVAPVAPPVIRQPVCWACRFSVTSRGSAAMLWSFDSQLKTRMVGGVSVKWSAAPEPLWKTPLECAGCTTSSFIHSHPISLIPEEGSKGFAILRSGEFEGFVSWVKGFNLTVFEEDVLPKLLEIR